MSTLFITILKMSLSASIAALVVILARLCLRKAPKIYSYILWSAVLFRLLCPFGLTIHLNIPTYSSPVYDILPEKHASVSYDSGAARQEYMYLIGEAVPDEKSDTGEAVQKYIPTESTNDETQTVVPASSSVMSKESIILLASCIWLAGTAVMLLSALLSYIDLRRKIGGARRICGNIYEADITDNAFVTGYINTRIIIPKGLDPDQLECMILHEQTHIRRGDDLVKLLAYFVLSLHWFNPLVWLSYSLMCEDMERSCDQAAVLRMTGDAGGLEDAKMLYGSTLVSMEERKSGIMSLAFSRPDIKNRLKSILDFSPVSYKALNRSTALLIAAAIFILSPADIAAVPVTYYDFSDVLGGGVDLSAKTIEYRMDRELTDITGIKKYSELEELDLSYDMISDISELSGLKRLKTLRLLDNEITDYSALSGLEELEHLEVSVYGSDLSELAVLKKLPKLKELVINCGSPRPGKECSPACDLSLLSELDGVTELSIYAWKNTCDISAVSDMKSLEKLSISTVSAELTLPEHRSGSVSETKLWRNTSEYSANDLLDMIDAIAYPENIRKLCIDPRVINTFRLLKYKNLEWLEINTAERSELGYLCTLGKLKELSYSSDAGVSGTELRQISKIASLRTLKIGSNGQDIDDISPIGEMTGLVSLDLSGSGIHDISALSKLYNLRYLNLANNNITSALPLSCLGELEELDLSGNDILPQYMPGSAFYADYVPDDSGAPTPELLTNGEMIVDGSTEIILFGPGDLSALTDSDIDSINSCGSLKEFRLEGADGGDLNVLPMFDNMETLKLTGCEETDLSVLTNIGSLRRLELSECGSVHDLSCLAGCNGLRSLTVEDCKGIDDRSIEDISRIASLEELSLNETDILYTDIITNITPLGRLSSLRSLRLCSIYGVDDISVIAKLPKLEELYLNSVRIHDVSCITSMTGLKRLEITGCWDSDIKDLSFLSGLDELEYLYISEMDVVDISPVAELGGLRELILQDLPINDISPLFDVKQLRRLEIKGCGGIYGQIGELYDALPDCEIIRKDSV